MELDQGFSRDVHTTEKTVNRDCVLESADLQITGSGDVREMSSTTVQLRSCVVIGSTTLAIFCTEHIRAAGHEVRLILATDKTFKTWATQEGLRLVDTITELEAELSKRSVDWLFSVVNPIILTPSIFQHVRVHALNYHDAPLPRFAGTNATAWALMAQEKQYAVSWHTIVAEVDAGQIAMQPPVSIELHDTAFSLNLKCYQAARESFRKLFVQLEQGNLVTWPQDLSKRSFNRRSRRPEGGAYLDWTQPAEALSAVVRGLDFGELYKNPLTCPKLMLQTNTIQINQIRLLERKSEAAPGTINAVSPEGWCITTGSVDVCVSKLATLEGNPIDPEIFAREIGLQPGTQLPQLTKEKALEIRKTLESLAPFESFWLDRLRVLQPIKLPYETLSELSTPQWVIGPWHEPLQSCAKIARWSALGALVIYLTRISGRSQLQLGWRQESVRDLLRSPKILTSIVPMQCDIEWDTPFAKVVQHIENEVTRLDKNKTYPRDLVSRYPDLRAIPALKNSRPWRIVVSMFDDLASEEADGALLTLQIDAQGRFRFIYDARCLDINAINHITDHLREPVVPFVHNTGQDTDVPIPPNETTRETNVVTPQMLPLIDISQDDIIRIATYVPGGFTNLQDIYALSPLQDDILNHHLQTTDSDPHLICSQIAFAERTMLNCYIAAIQQVVNQNDILRTAFVWKDISTPAQVVWRSAPLSVTELTLDPNDGPIPEQLRRRFNSHQYRIDLTRAPLMRLVIAEDKTEDRWILLILFHHLIGDRTTFDILHEDAVTFLENRGDTVPPGEPFRSYIARSCLGMSAEAHKLFFKQLLGGITQPTLPFGLTDMYKNSSQITEAHRMLSTELNRQLRAQATRLNVSLASLCYLAWAQVLSRTSGQMQVVFATVVYGRMRAGKKSERSMGLFDNVLPFYVDLSESNVMEAVRNTHLRLAELLEHQQASMTLAHQCSAVPANMPLSSALLNYHHEAKRHNLRKPGVEILGVQERTNYPFTLSVEDSGTALGLTARVQLPVESERVCGYMEQALISLANALEHTSSLEVHKLEILPHSERELLLRTWNSTETPYEDKACMHHLFEKQVERVPNATAIVHGDVTLSYEQLNTRANRLANRLSKLDVMLDKRIAICTEQSPALFIGIWAVLKVGAAYVPLDPSHPNKRLAQILADADPVVILADVAGRKALGDALLGRTVLDPYDEFSEPGDNLQVPGLTARHLAYIMYTSGSTGVPKGVMIEHRSIVNYSLYVMQLYETFYGEGSFFASSITFDLNLTAIYPTFLNGRILYLNASNDDPIAWRPTVLRASKLAAVSLTPSHLALLQNASDIKTIGERIHTMALGGEPVNKSLINMWHKYSPKTRIFNEYGPTEATVGCVTHEIRNPIIENGSIPIGRPMANARIYLIDRYGQLVPLGADGEIYIGGHGVARGYLNLPDLSAELFLPDPFVDDPDARMYKTGDLARYLSDGKLIYLGRNDSQIKIRGFRIETGEIETRLAEHPAVHEAVVLAVGDTDKRLVAYIIADEIEPAVLNQHLRTYLPEYMVPSSFIKVDSFPLTSNGKLDHAALSMLPDNTCCTRPFEAPTGPTEIALAEIWSELLGVPQVSRCDSFFALGGHSMLAIIMIQRAINCGIHCSLNDLFEQPVLADLACRITSVSLTKCHSQAIAIRSQGSEPPVFFVPSGLGDHSYVFSLARHIHSKYPVYALPWSFTSEQSSCTTQVLTENMVSFIKSVQPTGPYRIAGYSAGGMLAYAVAESLMSLNDSVAFVGLIDTAPPHLLRNLSTTQMFFEYLALHAGQRILDKMIAAGEKLNDTDCHHLISNLEQMQLIDGNLSREFIVSARNHINSFAKAISSYEPLSLPMNIHHFHSTDVPQPLSSENRLIFSKHDMIDGWKKTMSHARVQFVPVPGDHWTMMSEAPNREKLGEAINRALEALPDNSSGLETDSKKNQHRLGLPKEWKALSKLGEKESKMGLRPKFFL